MAEEKPKEDIIPGYSTIEDFTKQGFKTLVEATRVSNALPADKDWNYYKVYDSFNKIIQTESDKILRLMNSILHTQQLNVNIRNKDVEGKTELVIEANDMILEKAAEGIDDMNGIKKQPEAIEIQTVGTELAINGSWNQLHKATTFSINSPLDSLVNKRNDSVNAITLLTAKNIVRPQALFKDKIDNSNHPWIPRLTEKPNSIKPLAIFLEETEKGEMYLHPYEFELDHFQPNSEQLKRATPILPKPIEETPLKEVSTPEELNELLEHLYKQKEFAVDVEHHSYRTFMGITCLLQISTTECDYIIDTFALRDKLCILNEVFTKPTIVKIFHGADSDVEWLQRDLSLYIVNMFDTHQAAKQLQFSGLSLAYLLNRICNVVPNKYFQLADWRIRPLPDELKLYARMDTHYLIHIYHVLKNQLLDKSNGSDNILKSVIQQSTEICKKRYIKPLLHDESHLDLYRKCKRLFDNRQMYALKELYSWRDNLARTDDESTGYVLPNHMLLQISESLPREIQGILACCNPIPPLVRANLLELHRIILKAREQPVEKPILKEDTRSRGSTFKLTKINVDSPLHCPHDLTKQTEFRDDLPTLINFNNTDNRIEYTKNHIEIEKEKSMYSVFNTPESSDDENKNKKSLKKHNITFLGPYERYKLIKPFVQAEEEKAAAAEKEKSESNREEIQIEDRIAALHEHFVKVSKETEQKIPEPPAEVTDVRLAHPSNSNKHSHRRETLTAMGASKKRKYKDICDDTEQFHSDHKKTRNELHTPLPKLGQSNPQNKNLRRNKKKKNKKNRQYENSFENFDAESSNQPENPHHFESQEVCVQNGGGSSRGRGGKRKYNAKKNKKNPANEFNEDHSEVQNPGFECNPKRKRAKKNAQKDKSFESFDYSTVDFQQFQGGAGGSNANKGGGVKAQFKAKNKNKKFNKKSNNKSMTFNRPNN